MGSFSALHWVIVLVAVVLIFGTKKVTSIGSDLGDALKGFKDGMRDKTNDVPPLAPQQVPIELHVSHDIPTTLPASSTQW